MSIQAFASTLGATDAIVSGFDLMHMPEVFRELVGQYPEQRDLQFLEEMGASEEQLGLPWLQKITMVVDFILTFV